MTPEEQLIELMAELKTQGLRMTDKGFHTACLMLTQLSTEEIILCLKINEEQLAQKFNLTNFLIPLTNQQEIT